MSSPVPNPGLREQAGTRTALRIAGFVAIAAGLIFVIVAGVDFFGQDMSSEGPGKFWMFFVGLPLLAIGAWCLQGGFLGAATRYVAGETAPVVKDTAEYLTDGRGILGVGATGKTSRSASEHVYCTACGREGSVGDRFCAGCGRPLASA